MQLTLPLRTLMLAMLTAVALPSLATEVTWTDTATVDAENAGWGRLARLPDGRWLAVTTRYPGGETTTLQLSVSDDNARTWAPLSRVEEPKRKLDNGELIVLPDGRVLLAMRSLIDGVSYRLNVYASDDQGRSWRFLSTITRNESPAGRKDRGCGSRFSLTWKMAPYRWSTPTKPGRTSSPRITRWYRSNFPATGGAPGARR
ncbi:sialidase family protein [Stenotrophomonas sp.]|uniref:sialidase family protein n=1 Tax=Stenotrophomonas sp. TaxID=69392 RepID=UPI0028B22925|nr:sialidase family protein [Stenotrophomonas sp.]